MTSNQINYANYLESVRSDQAREAENYRSNRAQEKLKARSIKEDVRSHKAGERLKGKSIKVDMYNAKVNKYNAKTNRYNAKSNRMNAKSNAKNAATNAKNAITNAKNASTNAYNARINKYNAKTQRTKVSNDRKIAAGQMALQKELGYLNSMTTLQKQDLANTAALQKQHMSNVGSIEKQSLANKSKERIASKDREVKKARNKIKGLGEYIKLDLDTQKAQAEDRARAKKHQLDSANSAINWILGSFGAAKNLAGMIGGAAK